MENYFNYFTEIEEHFQRRRGTLLLLSPLDWALMEIWKDAGIPLQAVVCGIDTAFDKWQRRTRRSRKVNSLAYCAQEVLAAAEQMQEAAVGSAGRRVGDPALETAAIIGFLRRNAADLDGARLPPSVAKVADATAASLRELAGCFESRCAPSMEDVERRLTVMEEKLFAALLAEAPEAELVQIRSRADGDLAPYRSRMTAAQIGQLQKQYLHKRLLDGRHLPRLSLFYM